MKNLSHESVEEIREHFGFFDNDGNGFIDVREFIKLLQTISPKASAEQAVDGFELIDENSDGLIDFDEFIGWWKTAWYEY